MVHIVPYWTWPERQGEVTPIHVYTSGDEAELFINGKSQGRKKKGQYEYRLRWDDVTYEPGKVKVVAYKGGEKWATTTVETAGKAAAITLSPDRSTITDDGRDLSFIKATVVDSEGRIVPGGVQYHQLLRDRPGGDRRYRQRQSG
jgi:beta-galactosidase